MGFLFLIFFGWFVSGALCSAAVVVVGVATEKPGPTSTLCRVQVLLASTQTSALFICSEARRGYREVGLSGGSFTETWLMNPIPSDLTHFFSVVLEAPGCPTEKLWSALAAYC